MVAGAVLAIAVVGILIAVAIRFVLTPPGPDPDLDTEGEAVPAVGDPFPFDADEWSDADLDSVGDNADWFDTGNGAAFIVLCDLHGACPGLGGLCDLQVNLSVDTRGFGQWERRSANFTQVSAISGELVNETFDVRDRTYFQIAYRIELLDRASGRLLDFRSGIQILNLEQRDSWPASICRADEGFSDDDAYGADDGFPDAQLTWCSYSGEIRPPPA